MPLEYTGNGEGGEIVEYYNKAFESLKNKYELEKNEICKVIEETKIRQYELCVRREYKHIFFDFENEEERKEYDYNLEKIRSHEQSLEQINIITEFLDQKLEQYIK